MTPLPLISQLELVLRQLVVEHRALLAARDAHQQARRPCAIEQIERAARDQDAQRLKISGVESRRRQLVHQIARQQRTLKPITLVTLGELYPDRAAAIGEIRAELIDVAGRVQRKTTLIGRIASGVLGHVNATLRLIAQAATGPATYTARGEQAMPLRIGMLNAVA